MDIVTHVLLGATTGYAAGGNRVGRPAALAGAFGAVLPDLDVLLRRAEDPLFAIELHRHFSHSLSFSVLASIGTGLLVHYLFRRGRFGLTVLLVWSGYLSAILLDACTSYGTHLFWPFSDQRVALYIISIVDPVFTVVLILTLAVGIGRAMPAASMVGLLCCVCYLGTGAIQQHRARTLLAQTISSHHPEMTHTLLKPSFGNIIVWRGLAWNDHEIVSTAIRPGLFSADRVYAGERGRRPSSSQLADWGQDSARVQHDVRRFERLSGKLLIFHPSRPTLLGDARFALLPNSLEPLWGLELEATDAGDRLNYVTNRNLTQSRQRRFLDMLAGREISTDGLGPD